MVKYLYYTHAALFHTNWKVRWTTVALFKAVLCCVLHRFQQQKSVRLRCTFSQNASPCHVCYTHGQGKESAGSSLQETCWQPSFSPGWGHRTWAPGRQKKTRGRRRSAMRFPGGPFTSWWVPLYANLLPEYAKTKLLSYNDSYGNT